jgi:surface polysaccharide O-acyltransferase-like enzyme
MKRYYYLDYLRIYATIAVITIHVSAPIVTANPETDKISWFQVTFMKQSLELQSPFLL